ncbi:hypothetical protein MB02_10955 [Croceicoccus estronivorus]|nr:hypothetical protein MB02_10955 [Croceicoccus estronivorus]
MPACRAVPDYVFFIFSSPRIAPGLSEGLDAFCFFGFSALGLRISLFDFFWPLAMPVPIGAECPGWPYALIRAMAR